MRNTEHIQLLLTEFGKIWGRYFPDMSFFVWVYTFERIGSEEAM